jgi:hypothetical protein
MRGLTQLVSQRGSAVIFGKPNGKSTSRMLVHGNEYCRPSIPRLSAMFNRLDFESDETLSEQVETLEKGELFTWVV